MGLPAAIIFAGFYFVPFIANLRYSLTRWDRITEPEFVGFRNFINLLTNDDLFYKVLGNNLRFTFLVVLFQTLFSLIFAIFLVKNTRANIALRTLFFFPTILSSVSVGMIWLFMYDPNFGAINLFFTRLGLEGFALNWLGSESSALYAITFTQVWFHTGQMMVIYIAGLQQIPQELYEAAEMDGASRWQQFRNVTWPMSIPTTIVVMAYTTIQSFRAFDLIFAMTQGGPNNSSNIFAVLIYQTVFSELRIGYAATQSIFFIIVLVFVTLLQRKFLNSRYEK
ncbi:MAG TPA: sugar ABC transporter permease [Candidatus Nanopelagicaceae bacterium]|mgnify:FL=1|jgi:raffinose/stachyose/melibiose transport system permease protein|nr:sugar ABC transporter permease [Candidatus Nanopelagicaceae bacterium]